MLNYDYIQHIKKLDYNCIRGFQYEKYVLNKLHDFYDIKEIYLWSRKNLAKHSKPNDTTNWLRIKDNKIRNIVTKKIRNNRLWVE